MTYKRIKWKDDFEEDSYKEWRNDQGLFHRDDGPAYISYYPDGRIRYCAFLVNGQSQRSDGPAEIWYNEDGTIIYEKFWISGFLLGEGKEGFWELWNTLSEESRKQPGVLKSMMRYL
jgi:antitoxin component YwqK of YwqJK toxin-antitoxin module